MQNKFYSLCCSVLCLLGISAVMQEVFAKDGFCAVGDISCSEEKAKPQNEIKISETAIKNYEITTKKFEKNSFITLPRSAFAVSQNQYFVYGVKNGVFIEFVPYRVRFHAKGINFLNEQPEEIMFLNEQLFDEFVVTGAKYLRMISLSQQTPASGHSH